MLERRDENEGKLTVTYTVGVAMMTDLTVQQM